MPLTVVHPFVSGKADSSDTSLVRPSNWNASHSVSGTVDVANGGTGQTTEAAAIGALVNALTQDSSPDPTADFFPSYDADLATGKKVLLNSLYLNNPFLYNLGLSVSAAAGALTIARWT